MALLNLLSFASETSDTKFRERACKNIQGLDDFKESDQCLFFLTKTVKFSYFTGLTFFTRSARDGLTWIETSPSCVFEKSHPLNHVDFPRNKCTNLGRLVGLWGGIPD
jgi:hypothetical protein